MPAFLLPVLLTNTNSIKFIPTSELCQKSYNKQNFCWYSHSISHKFVQLLLFRQAPKGEYLIKGKGLYAVLLILTRTLSGK
jgi:hypothetical protein